MSGWREVNSPHLLLWALRSEGANNNRHKIVHTHTPQMHTRQGTQLTISDSRLALKESLILLAPLSEHQNRTSD
jgi:hypothetical protein